MDVELCPLDDRRTREEILLKVAVVHFTTMTAYCHLLSIRGESTGIICRKMLYFFLCPASIIIRHILAVLFLLGTSILVRLTNTQSSAMLQASLERGPAILFGRIDRPISKSRRRSKEKGDSLKLIGRVVVALALAAQCIGSCIIFARRYERDAATWGDWLVVELAAAGLLTSLLTVVYLLWESRLRLSPRHLHDLSHGCQRTYLDVALLFLRDVPVPRGSPPCKHDMKLPTGFVGEYTRIVFNAPILFGVYCARPSKARQAMVFGVRNFLFGGLIGLLDRSGSWAVPSQESGLVTIIRFSVLQLSVFLGVPSLVLFLVVGVGEDFWKKWKDIRSWQARLRWLTDKLITSLCIWASFAVVWCLLIFIVQLPVDILFMAVSRISDFVLQLKVLAVWPTSLECPLLWSDPTANFLWHLM